MPIHFRHRRQHAASQRLQCLASRTHSREKFCLCLLRLLAPILASLPPLSHDEGAMPPTTAFSCICVHLCLHAVLYSCRSGFVSSRLAQPSRALHHLILVSTALSQFTRHRIAAHTPQPVLRCWCASFLHALLPCLLASWSLCLHAFLPPCLLASLPPCLHAFMPPCLLTSLPLASLPPCLLPPCLTASVTGANAQ
jgi:hypothetical protein